MTEFFSNLTQQVDLYVNYDILHLAIGNLKTRRTKMVGRFLARAMMVAIMAVTVWLANLTWQSNLVFGQKVLLTIIESTVFLSNLSLLIQSVMSFGTTSVKHDSLLYFFGGYAYLPESSEKTQLNTHYCLLAWVRSLVLATLAMLIGVISFGSYSIVSMLISFFSNPSLPVFTVRELAISFGLIILVFTCVIAVAKVFELFYEKLLNRNIVVRWILLSLFVSVCAGLFFGSVVSFVPSPEFEGLNWLSIVMLASGVFMALSSVAGVVMGLSYYAMRLVKNASEKYSILGRVWNTFCPVQTINVVR